MKRHGLKISVLVITQLFCLTTLFPASAFQDFSHRDHLRTPSLKGSFGAKDGSGKQLLQELGLVSKDGATRQVANVREDIAKNYPDLFGTKTVNGRQVNVEQAIATLTKELGPEIAKALSARQKLLDSKAMAREKHAFPKWGETFEDAEGNVWTFGQIVQGLIDNFLGRDTEWRWRLNDEVLVPDDAHPLKNPGLELTGPWHPLDMAMNQINADVAAIMPDWEDASPADYVPFNSPSDQPVGTFAAWHNAKELIEGKWNNRAYEVVKKGEKREYKINKPRNHWPTLFHRVPSIHLRQTRITADGQPVPAIIPGYLIYALNNYGSLTKAGTGVYYYQPKIQTAPEALIVEKLLRRTEGVIGVRPGTIKIKALYEEGRAGLHLPAILWAWRSRLIGTNVGRWDYLGSLIEMWKDEAVFPDPQSIGMTSPNMMAYQRYNALLNLMAGIKEGELSNAAPIGGMAAVMLYPKTDLYGRWKNNPNALRQMKLDKLRERLIGLIFVSDEPLPKGKSVTLEKILAGRIKGRLYDTYRQSWVATPDAAYVAAGNAPLKADVAYLQAMIDAPEAWEEIDGKKVAPTATSGLIREERELLQTLGLVSREGKIVPWVIAKEMFNKPEKLFTEKLWEDLYSVPKGDITVENIQRAFYMAAQYGFQILNGNYAAAIDDYVLRLRFMNDLATYRIFVGWLWTVFHHQAPVTKNGYLKLPAFDPDLGVIPAMDALEVKTGTRMTPELFEKLWEFHNEWTEAFFKEQDSLAAKHIVERHAGTSDKRDELTQQVASILSRAYAVGPFQTLSSEDTATEIAKLLGVAPADVETDVEAGAPRFDRSKASLIMDVLKRQLLSQRWIQHSPRVLFAIAEEANATQRVQILGAIFSPSREDVVRAVENKTFNVAALSAHDFVYDIFPDIGSKQKQWKRNLQMARLERDWKENPRWNGIVRTYTPKEVINLHGTFHVEYTLAKRGSERFWNLLHNEPYILALGALTGNQAKEQVRGGLKAIYASGWQIAADANVLGQTLPDLSLYPHNSGPKLVEALNNALQRQDQIEFSEGKEGGIDWQAPIILDMEAGLGGPKQLHVATMEAIKAGASAIHIEDQGDKKCGHMGGKCLVSTGKMVERVQAARLTADIAGVPLVIIGRTDAEQAKFLETTGVPEPVDQALVLGTTPDGKEMTYAEARAQGFAGEWTDKGVGGTWTPKIRSSQHGVKLYEIKPGLEAAIKRALSYAPYVEFLWKETNAIDLEEDQKFAEAIHTKYPGKLLAYNLSPSLNWGLIDKETRERYHRALAEMGYRYQFVTLAGFHTLNLSMFELATAFKDRGMAAYYDLVQKPEFEAQVKGYTAVKHQREAGTGYFDKVEEAIGSGTGALEGSTEEAQFNKEAKDGADRRVGLTDRERVVEDTARWKVARTIAKYWTTLSKNPGALLISPLSLKQGQLISVRTLADPRLATLAIDAALFEQKTTREEFEIILSMLKETLPETGSEKVIWLIQTNPDASYKPFLEELAKQYNFVQLLSLQAYHEKLDQLKEEELLFGLLRVGYEENKTSMRLTDQDVWVRRPDEKKKEIVSAFSFMSLALLKDPEFASIRSQLGDLLKGIGQALVIRPTPEYLEAVKVIHQQI